jgi:hypothetical protein
MNIDSAHINAMLEAVSGKMRELGVKRFDFEESSTPSPGLSQVSMGTAATSIRCSIELGERPVSADRVEEERIQRIRDAQEINSMEREERRKYAASARIGPKPRHIT